MAKKIEEILSSEPKTEPPVNSDPVEAQAPAEPTEIETETAPLPESGVSDSGDPLRQIAGLKAASTSERKKRQEAEARYAALEKERAEEREYYRKQLDRLTAQPARQPETTQVSVPKPSIFEDPETWERHVVGGVAQNFEQKLQQQHYQFSEILARKTYKEEFDEAEKWAASQLQQNPSHPLRHMIVTSQDPGETLVQEYRKNKQLQEMSDPVAYRQKVIDEMLNDPAQRKVLLERLGAEPLRQASSPSLAPSALPTPLAGARSMGSKGPAWTGPTPLEAIVPRGGARKA